MVEPMKDPKPHCESGSVMYRGREPCLETVKSADQLDQNEMEESNNDELIEVNDNDARPKCTKDQKRNLFYNKNRKKIEKEKTKNEKIMKSAAGVPKPDARKK